MRRLRFLAFAGSIVCLALLISNAFHRSHLTEPLNANRGEAPATEKLTPVVRKYAPFIYAALDKTQGRQDLISNIDFDGDLIGNNNWENFESFELTPTVYYTILETDTHYFIAYHLFHPRDWNHFTFWLNDTHENDGENFQIVVRKNDGRVVMLWTQAHYGSRVYANPECGITDGAVKLRGRFETLDSNGVPSETGTHPAVFVESQGHGIYGTLDADSEVTVNRDGTFLFRSDSGLRFVAAPDGEPVREPDSTQGRALYRLDSVKLKLWPLLRDGELTGDGKLFDGCYAYIDDLVDIPAVPRFYDGNRFSGPLGNDRGISPFALDFNFKRGTLGALFFNPARRYHEQLQINGKWSLRYLDYPFTE